MTEPQTDPGTTADETGNEPAKRAVMVEWVNEPPHGVELHRARTLSRAEVKEGWGLTISRDLEWTRDNGFRLVIQENDRALTPEVLEWLAKDPKFEIHYEEVREPAPGDEGE